MRQSFWAKHVTFLMDMFFIRKSLTITKWENKILFLNIMSSLWIKKFVNTDTLNIQYWNYRDGWSKRNVADEFEIGKEEIPKAYLN